MNVFTEGNLRIEFPSNVSARKFDDSAHGLSHCMKAVDFIVEEHDRVSYVEIKDPDHPCAKEEDKEKFASRFQSGSLDHDLQYKYRDTFLYQWAAGKTNKPIFYWVIIAIETLKEPQLPVRSECLRRKLPVGPYPGTWTRPIATDCMVFNVSTWNRYQKRFPLSRIT